MPRWRLTIRTSDGECASCLFTPSNKDGRWPAVVVYMDAGGIRPTLMDMAQRIAVWTFRSVRSQGGVRRRLPGGARTADGDHQQS